MYYYEQEQVLVIRDLENRNNHSISVNNKRCEISATRKLKLKNVIERNLLISSVLGYQITNISIVN